MSKEIPDGWSVRVYYRKSDAASVLQISGDCWLARDSRSRDILNADGSLEFPSAAAAIAAVEEKK